MQALIQQSRPRLRAAGFSLLELLIVVAILVVLTTLYWGPSGASKQRAGVAGCEKNLQKLGICLTIFASDNQGAFPNKPGARTSEEALAALVPKYTGDRSIFICPSSSNKQPADEGSLTNSRISYAYYMGRKREEPAQSLMTDRQINTDSKNQGAAVFSTSGKPPGNNHGNTGGNVLLSDGSVIFSGPAAALSLSFPEGITLLNPKP